MEGSALAQLTYTGFTGELAARSDDGRDVAFTMYESEFSNYWWNSSQKEMKNMGLRDTYQQVPYRQAAGAFIDLTPCIWTVGNSDRIGYQSDHSGRTLIYLHPAGTQTERCIAISRDFERERAVVQRDAGGWLTVIGGDLV